MRASGLPRAWAALVVAVPALLLGAWLASALGGRGTEAGEPRSAAAPDAELVDRLEREIASLRGELERAREGAAESAGLRGELERTRGEVASRIESLERALDAAQRGVERAASAAVEPDAARSASSPEQATPVSAGGASEQEAQRTVAAPAREARAPELASGAPPQPAPSDPGELADLRARGFDRALAALESGRASEALGRLEGLIAQRVFSGLEGDGSALLWSLCSGSSALAGNGRSGGTTRTSPDAPSLAEARAALERSLALRPDFGRAAASWLGAAGPAYTAPERLERLDLALEGLAQSIDWAKDELAAQHDPDWERIRALGVPQDPTQVVQHATAFDCGHEAEICEKTANAYTVDCLWSGDVDRAGLARAAHLAAWGQRALARPAAERSEPETDLLWLWYARRWFVDAERPDAFDWTGLDAPEEVASADDWRAELQLAIELSASGFQWPGAVGARALYRVDSGGPARWRVDETRRIERDSAGWQLDRQHFDARGKPLGAPAEVRIERSGDRYGYAGASGVLLDLRASGANVSVAPSALTAQAELPELEGVEFTDLADREAFAQAAARTCLVFQDGEWTRWFAPGLGLVREVRNGSEGAVRVELCALGALP
jgi:hypothetical protein